MCRRAPALACIVASLVITTIADRNRAVNAASDTTDNQRVQAFDGVVAGHTALANASVQARALNCELVMQKITNEFTMDLELRRMLKMDEDLAEEELVQKLQSGKKGELIAELIEAELSSMDLNEGLQHGSLVTAKDVSTMVDCETGVQDNLEEHTSTVRQGEGPIEEADPIIQGDMAAPHEDPNCLLELQQAADEGRRWAGNPWVGGRIPYCFDNSGPVDAGARTAYLEAIDHIQVQVPCVTFVPVQFNDETKSCSETPSLLLRSHEKGCWSYVGDLSQKIAKYKSQSQAVNLGHGCHLLGTAAHEFGHALGMTHEQSRPDRDKWVKIVEKNVKAESFKANFPISEKANVSTNYDFLSLMHYSAYAFSANGEMTVVPFKDLRKAQYLGQRVGFSEYDIEHIGEMYGCVDRVKPISTNKDFNDRLIRGTAENDLRFTGKCEDSKETGFKGSNGKTLSCKGLTKWCGHEKLGPKVRNLCPVSCYLCKPTDENADERHQDMRIPAEDGLA